MAGPRVPVLVVSGFLGSGKTTLVRHLLADAQSRGVRLAVITNEFGELGIDEALVGARPEESVELRGGCICCRLSDDLVETLQSLFERARPDRIVVETSGVALPYDVQMNLWRDPVRGWMEDDVAAVVVDAHRLREGAHRDETFTQQVSAADLLVLNQVDRVSAADLPELERLLREIEPDAPILRAVHGQVEPDLLFPPDPEGRRAARREEALPPPAHTHEDFVSEEIAIERGVDADALRERLRDLAVLRVKGFVETAQGPRLVQGVGPRIDLRTPDAPPPPELLGRLVVIQRGRS